MSPGSLPTAATMRFGELDIAYDDRLLVPREWTLAQSRWASEILRTTPPGRVLELCSGAGHIGLHAVLESDRALVCVDDAEVACDYTRRNAQAAGLAGRVEVRCARLEEALAPDERFALVVADPPWVPSGGIEQFPEDPPHAIDGGADGLDLVRAVLTVAGQHLVEGGSLLLQVGPGQEAGVAERAGTNGLVVVDVRHEGDRGSLIRLDRHEGSD
ncbi:methyltransferase [Nocardioides piscis]|uniref:Methyltransferase n=1 Tax=Nocardioides piscis TaxID=2714938 RepID=A0A6G7YER0_9ACTN|nr:methyltransferase [Nocardioides piscis]QIK75128.1 methyltransferase [Nocardioides piscis]